MSIEQLRDGIWNYLFERKASQTIDELASLAAQDTTVIRAAVDHEWFRIEGDQVGIAYSPPQPHEPRSQSC